nr:ATP-binding protein [Rhodococcus rhodnii]
MRVRLAERTLAIANTGVPVTAAGVQSMLALRASSKTDLPHGDRPGGEVGRFGVGFTSVLSVADDVEVRSTSGSVAFSAERTRAALAADGVEDPGEIAVLRLAWPIAAPPPDGFETEIVLRLRDDVDTDALLAAITRDAPDLLLELPSVASIDVAGDVVRRDERERGAVTEIAVGDQRWWQVRAPHARWLIPVRGETPRSVGDDVLRAPTASDEALSLPARIVADVAMAPDRRRVAADADVPRLAAGYADVVSALPPEHRARLVPAPGFPRSEVDAVLREALVRELAERPWVPTVAEDGVAGGDVPGSRARVFGGLTDELAAIVGGVVGDLAVPALSGSRETALLLAAGAARLDLAGLAELLEGVGRPPAWWGRLYDALAPFVVDSVAAEELATLPVPLSDGRRVTGPRTVVSGDADDLAGVTGVTWARLAHPDADRPLLARLGARRASAVDLLDDPALRALIDDAADDLLDADETAAVTEAVMALAARVPVGAAPVWLGGLLLPDSDGDEVPADQLLVPSTPLAGLLIEDAPFRIVADDAVARWGEHALRVVGVGDGFAVPTVDPADADELGLDEFEVWSAARDVVPEQVTVVRDLDLVDPDRWREALTVLAADPAVAPLLADRDGYTAWWLRGNVVLAGRPIAVLRAPGDPTFAGLLDAVEHPAASALTGLLAGARVESPVLARRLVAALGERDRAVAPDVVARAHGALARAVADGTVEVPDIEPPEQVRGISGAVVAAEDALVLDAGWYAHVVDPDRLVVGDLATAEALADLLDLPTASSRIDASVLGAGERVRLGDDAAAVTAFAAAGAVVPDATVTLHDRLRVRVGSAVTGEYDVPWWVDPDGTLHCVRGAISPTVVAGARR